MGNLCGKRLRRRMRSFQGWTTKIAGPTKNYWQGRRGNGEGVQSDIVGDSTEARAVHRERRPAIGEVEDKRA